MTHFVYFAQTEENTIKVGWCKNPARRLYDLQLGSPSPLKCIGLLRLPTKHAALAEERRISDELRPWRLRSGWFRPPDKELRRVMRGAEPFVEPAGTISKGRISQARVDPDRHPRSSIRWSEIDWPDWMDEIDRSNLRRLYRTPGATKEAVRRMKQRRGETKRGRRPALSS